MSQSSIMSTARSRPVVIASAVLILLLLSIFGLAHQTDTLDGFSLSSHSEYSLEAVTDTFSSAASKPHKEVVIYVYYETVEAKINFQFFLNHALHDKMDFIFVVNGDELTVDIPVADNIQVIRRPNTCFDLGTYGEIVKANNSAIRNRYERFILMNASIRGPFLPRWAKMLGTCWSDIFTTTLTDTTKLIGLTANCDNGFRHHLQSMLLSVDQIGLDLIMPALHCESTLWNAVINGETALTMMVREAGFYADPIYALRDREFYETSEHFWDKCSNSDAFFHEGEDGMDVHPFDTVFVKPTRRDVLPYGEAGQLNVDKLTQYVIDSRYSSYDYCH